MNTIIIHPETKAKEKAIKAVLEALDINFEQEVYSTHVMDGLKKGIIQSKNGQTKSYSEVKEILANRWH
jgi:hypothetical protein